MSTSTTTSNEQTTDSWGFTKFSKLLFSTILFVMIVVLGIQFIPIIINMLSSGPEIIPVYLLIFMAVGTLYYIMKILRVTLAFNKEYDIGTRKQKECGVEYVEASTGRYSIWSSLYAKRESKELLMKPLRRLIWLAITSSIVFIALDIFIFNFKQTVAPTMENSKRYKILAACFVLILITYGGIFHMTSKVIMQSKYLTDNGITLERAVLVRSILLLEIVFAEIFVICVIRNMIGFPLKNLFDVNLRIYIVIILYILVTYTFINLRLEKLIESLSKYNELISKLDISYSTLSSCLDETSKNILTKNIVYNIKHEQHADGNDSDILKNYATELARYITHKKGNELNDVYVLLK